jgi:hypothetical protein
MLVRAAVLAVAAVLEFCRRHLLLLLPLEEVEETVHQHILYEARKQLLSDSIS